MIRSMRVNRYAGILFLALAPFALLPAQDAAAWGRFEGGHHPAYGGGWAHRPPGVVHRTYVERGGGGCVGCGVGVAAVAGLLGGAVLGAAIAANSAPPPQVIYAGPPMGAEVAALPPGCASMNINGANLYQCGPTWYQPYFGGNGVYYTVVPGPG